MRVPLQFQWNLVVVFFQPCVLCRLAIYCEEGAVFLREIAAFEWPVELVTPLWKEGCPIRSEWSCGDLDDVNAKIA